MTIAASPPTPSTKGPDLYPSWRGALESAISRGQGRTTTIRHQGDLSRARSETLSQYFTPLNVARFMSSLVAPAIDRATSREGGLCTVIDTSCGSGRLFHFLDTEKCLVDGADIDGRLIEALGRAASAAGIPSVLETACLSQIAFRGYSAALINPPFSVPLSSPVMDPLPCTAHGKYGPHTSAVSHHYALEQALDGAEIVCALLPASQAGNLPPVAVERLVARFWLPSTTFQEENCRVTTAICLFAPSAWPESVHEETLDVLPAHGPDFGLICSTYHRGHCVRLRIKGFDSSSPTITRQVTGRSKVRVYRSGRKIRLRFECGLIEARVLNAVLRSEIVPEVGQRLPKGWRYVGQGALDVHVHLAQPSPMRSVQGLLDGIREAGGTPEVDPALTGHLRTLIRRRDRILVPAERWVMMPSNSKDARFQARAREAFMLDPSSWASPSVLAGEEIQLTTLSADRFEALIDGQPYTLSRHEVERRFDLPAQERGWQQIHPGRTTAFPAAAAAIERRMVHEGIDTWLTWPHQISSVIENKMVGRGLLAWRMSLGKARGAIALCLLGGRHNVIVVEPYLVDEMRAELEGLALECWQEIRRISDLDTMARINLVTYNTLRANRGAIARRLRRRCHTVVLDEADILSNPHSQRSRATRRLAGRETYLLTGTPQNNYPRDIHPLVAHAWGDATAWQPYGVHGPYLDPSYRHSAGHVRRGIDQFREDFCTLVWTTNEFAEDNRSGAKREIPVIADPPKFRQWISPLMSRWTGFEPPLHGHLSIPVPRFRRHIVAWDDPHLAHYLKVAEEFRAWYLKAQAEGGGKNLVAILARIGAVEVAANVPHQGRMDPFTPTTSKQRAVVARAAALARKGEKTIVVARYPAMLDRMATLLQQEQGISSICVHGQRSIAERNRALREDFRQGDVNVAFVSYGCGERGLNLPEASRILLASRCWKSTTENQVIARLCRAQQRNDVWAEHFELEGSIDRYQAQMCEFKAEAELVGVDFGDSSIETEEFDHIDTILGRFVQGLVVLRGCKTASELRQLLAA